MTGCTSNRRMLLRRRHATSAVQLALPVHQQTFRAENQIERWYVLKLEDEKYWLRRQKFVRAQLEGTKTTNAIFHHGLRHRFVSVGSMLLHRHASVSIATHSNASSARVHDCIMHIHISHMRGEHWQGWPESTRQSSTRKSNLRRFTPSYQRQCRSASAKKLFTLPDTMCI